MGAKSKREFTLLREPEARRDLAALYRLAVNYGWTDLTSTHISARIDGEPDHYLLNSHDLLFDEICASNLVKMAYDGEMDLPGRVLNQAGHIIHSSVLQARPDINFVMHSHTRAGIAVSAMPQGLMALSQHAGFVLGTLSTHKYQDSTAVANEGELLARDLGNNYCMLLENHGILVVGRTAAEVFKYHYMMEMSCKIQIDVLSCCDNPIEIEPEALEALIDWGDPNNGTKGWHHWDALIRKLDRTQPDYKD
ncbi:MAG: class II aldolase/adducin family protein [Pseudomonadota bacterium]